MSLRSSPVRPGRSRLLSAPLLALVLAACSPDVGLRVGDVEFTAQEIRGLSDSQIDRLVAITVVGIATSAGEPLRAVAPLLEDGRDDARIAGLRRALALERQGVSDAALEARYANDPDYQLTVRHLVVLAERWRTEPERSEARERAESALERARAGEPFPELAGEVSEEPGAAERGGLLEPGREGTWVDEFWDAAIGLEVGETSEVVETEYGFHVLHLEDRQPISFEEAREEVVTDVVSEIEDRGAWEAWVAEQSDISVEEVRSAYPEVPQAARAVLLAEAERREIGVSVADEAELVRTWESRLAAWGGLLGFEPEMPVAAVGSQALEALGATGQNARLARDEILEWAEVLALAYPVERPAQ